MKLIVNFGFCLVLVFILSTIYTDYRRSVEIQNLRSEEPIDKIEMKWEDKDSIYAKMINDSALMKRIADEIKKNIEINRGNSNIILNHVELKVFKRSHNSIIRVLDNPPNGFMIEIGNNYYKNDTLISVLKTKYPNIFYH